IVVRAVAVLLEVGLIVFPLVGNQIVQREAVVTGDEVDALLGFALLVTIKVGAADVAIGKGTDGVFFGAKEVAHVVAEFAVPLAPAIAHEAADLIEAGGIPG